MTHIDLFSGIGGFAYAAKQVWPDYHNLFFCDNNKFCQAVLRKNFGQDSLIYGDIREVTVEGVIADTEHLRKLQPEGCEQNKRRWIGNGTILTAGFPCQPFSVAGKRSGTKDDRFLWPETIRIIKEIRPEWIILENVAGLLSILEPTCSSELEIKAFGLFHPSNNIKICGVIERIHERVIGKIINEIEQAGYILPQLADGTPVILCLPACAVNAPHRRDRVWIVAHAERTGTGSECGEVADQGWETGENRREGIRLADGAAGAMRITAADRHAADTEIGEREARLQDGSKHQERKAWEIGGRRSWGIPWLEVATRLCRVDDGLPAGVDGNAKGIPGGYKVKPGGEIGEYLISKSKHREERLKALGNAIVPQVAVEIMKAILMKP